MSQKVRTDFGTITGFLYCKPDQVLNQNKGSILLEETSSDPSVSEHISGK